MSFSDGKSAVPQIPVLWGRYAILKRQEKPVEMLRLPFSKHNLHLPSERFISQQGTVDWFDFWLNDRERTEPFPGAPETTETLAEQYERWRRLRELQEKSEVEAIKARHWHKEETTRREDYEQWAREREAANDEAPPTAEESNANH